MELTPQQRSRLRQLDLLLSKPQGHPLIVLAGTIEEFHAYRDAHPAELCIRGFPYGAHKYKNLVDARGILTIGSFWQVPESPGIYHQAKKKLRGAQVPVKLPKIPSRPRRPVGPERERIRARAQRSRQKRESLPVPKIGFPFRGEPMCVRNRIRRAKVLVQAQPDGSLTLVVREKC